MLFENIFVINENFELSKNMFVGISGNTIKYIGKTAPPEDFGRRYDGTGKLLSPAFYNAHAHSAMSLLRGYGENMALSDWLTKRIFPFEAQLTPDDVYLGTILSAAEGLRFGIVSSTDMYFFSDQTAKAFCDCGVKANISSAIVSFDDIDYKKHAKYAEANYLYKNFHDAGGGAIKIDIALHAEYTSSERIARGVAEHAKELGANMHLHLSETLADHLACKELRGMTQAKYFEKCGLLDTPTTAAHCVFLEKEDFEILAEKKATIATCPKSNLKLCSGIADIKTATEHGINVAIGTDGVASNNNLNMLEEIRFFSLLQKNRSGDPTFITPGEAIYAATRAGALSQGRENCGLIKEGFAADLCVFDLDKIYLQPVHNVLNNLVYSGSGTDVVLTMADGKILYENSEYFTIDIEKSLKSAEEIIKRVKRSL